MTSRVLKWDVDVDDQLHQVGGGPVVHVGCQHRIDQMQVWTEETGDGPSRFRTVQVYGTGHVIPDGAIHLGTTMTANGDLVWHLYQLGEVAE